jgi:hypothetical protein
MKSVVLHWEATGFRLGQVPPEVGWNLDDARATDDSLKREPYKNQCLAQHQIHVP